MKAQVKVMGKMPVLFVGHGSPMNAIDNNSYTAGWREIADHIPVPEGILAISAHWYTRGLRVNTDPAPRQVYDMYGFPQELYELKYPAKGSPKIAGAVSSLLGSQVQEDNSWGIDHGTWSVLWRMYPQAEFPICQLSVDMTATAEEQFLLGQKLRALREQGILILGSGNDVHNLRRVNWTMEGGYGWADVFDRYIKDKITAGKYADVCQYQQAGAVAEKSFSTPEHFYPLLTVLGAAEPGDSVKIFNEDTTLGALSMTSYLLCP